MKNVPFILTDSSVTLIIAGHPYTMSTSNASFSEVKNRIANQQFDNIEQLFNSVAGICSFTKGNINVKNGEVLYKGQPIHHYVVEKILAFMREGLPYQPLINFLEKLLTNPSYRAVTELFGFLEASNLPICEDGDFLAYRKVTHDYKDFYTKTFDNSIGKTVEVPRNTVDEDKDRTCSHGLHFCSQAYLSHYHGGDGKVVIIKINPADAVSIPTDYANAKGRCCKYVVFSDCEGHEAGEQFGALYRENPEVAFDDGKGETGYTSNDSHQLGLEVGLADASYGLERDADDAFDEIDEDDVDEQSFIQGYNDGYDEYYANQTVQVSAPKVKTAPRTISESTREKLRTAARRQKRDADGKYI